MKIEHPEEGTYRLVKRFAWLPRRLGTTTVWLEAYYVLEKYVPSYYGYYWRKELSFLNTETENFEDIIHQYKIHENYVKVRRLKRKGNPSS